MSGKSWLTPIRARVLGFIEAETRAGRPFPSARQVADYMGWDDDERAQDQLIALVVLGEIRIKRLKPWGRSMRKEYERVAAA
jgi:hypothetical protein